MLVLTQKIYNPKSLGEEALRINLRVDFRLTDFMPSDRQDIHYDLFAVINHHQSSKSGHYTVQCKINDSNHWCKYNDNNYKMELFIDKQNKNKILVKYQNLAYVLFYKMRQGPYHCKLEVKSDRTNKLMNSSSRLIEILKILNMILPLSRAVKKLK
jgi:hypothetical protein